MVTKVLKMSTTTSGDRSGPHDGLSHQPSNKLPALESRGFSEKRLNDSQSFIQSERGARESVGLPQLCDLTSQGSQRKERHSFEKTKHTSPRSPRSRCRAYNKSRQTHWSLEDEKPKVFNPDPLPYQARSFKCPLQKVSIVGVSLPTLSSVVSDQGETGAHKQTQERSSTVIKKVKVEPRHQDLWGGFDYSLKRSKGFIFHADRYQWDELRRTPESQGDRMQAEMAFVEKLQGMKRRREGVPHREPANLQMGGRSLILFERMDITDELRKLKSVALPTKAKDLYIGRGFRMPRNHTLSKQPTSPERDQKKRENTAITQPEENDVFYDTQEQQKLSKPNAASKEATQPAPAGVSHSSSADDKNAPRPAQDVEQNNGPSIPLIHSSCSIKPENTHPLKYGPVENLLTEAELSELRKTFRRLDTDLDGHVMFNQLKSELPKEMTNAQNRFIKQVYDINSANTFFGLDEFICLSILWQRIAKLSGAAKDSYQRLDFATLQNSLQKYVEMFQSVDRQQVGKVSVKALKEILSTVTEQELTDEVFQPITEILMEDGESTTESIDKMDYLALTPYFISLEPK